MADKVVVTGGAGFIGSNLVRALLGRGIDVHSIDNYSAGKLSERFIDGATYHELDIRDTKRITDVLSGTDVVFHTAAKPRVQVSIEDPLSTTDHNVTGTVSVLKAATDAGVRRVVYSSSSSVYGAQETLPLKENMPAAPVHPYGLQKCAAEMFTSLWPSIYKLETVSLRYFNIYGPLLDPEGPYALAVGRFITARKNKEPITIYGDGTVTRDFTHVSDVVSANVLASESLKVGKGEVINIGAGRNVSIQALADMFGGEIVYGPPRIEAHDSLADISRARELLGWAPKVKLEDGVAELKKLFGIA
jgi:nucleoside-diphosphate-sugar epimerase